MYANTHFDNVRKALVPLEDAWYLFTALNANKNGPPNNVLDKSPSFV
jgi:hypothetical protein